MSSLTFSFTSHPVCQKGLLAFLLKYIYDSGPPYHLPDAWIQIPHEWPCFHCQGSQPWCQKDSLKPKSDPVSCWLKTWTSISLMTEAWVLAMACEGLGVRVLGNLVTLSPSPPLSLATPTPDPFLGKSTPTPALGPLLHPMPLGDWFRT